MNKVILIDFSHFMFSSIWAWKKSKINNPTYTALNSIIACLKKVGVNKDDLIILTLDRGKSWRKKVEKEYKAGRVYDEDFQYWFPKFNELLDNLEVSTPFNIVELWGVEADDIIATAVKHFKDYQKVIISADSDLEQLWIYKNVYIFSPKSKRYKIRVKNPFKVLMSKIKKEKTDNLVKPVLSEKDFEKRNKVVNLINLPSEIEKEVIDILKKLPLQKSFNIAQLKFPSLIDRLISIYDNNKIVTYEQSLKKRKRRGKYGRRTKKMETV